MDAKISDIKTITMNVDTESVDIPTMYELSDDVYREFVRAGGLFDVDNHGSLRSIVAGYPLATTVEQLDILIDELQQLRHKIRSRPA